MIIFIIFGVPFYSCGVKNLKDSNSPESNIKLKRIPGTKAFAEIPNNCKWVKESNGYIFDNTENFLKCVYLPVRFSTMKESLESEIIHSPNMKIDEFQVEGKNAILLHGYSKIEKRQVYMYILDTEIDLLITAFRIQDTNLVDEQSVLQIIKSIRHIDTFNLDKFELLDYEFDDKISGFEYIYTIGNQTSYHLRNKPEDMNRLVTEKIMINTIPIASDDELKKRYHKSEQNEYLKNINSLQSDTLINNKNVLIFEMEYDSKKKRHYSLIAIFKGSSKYYSFSARTDENISEMKKIFHKTIGSFRIK